VTYRRPPTSVLHDYHNLIEFSILPADPHIKVAGRLDDVRTAKEKIMEVLDTRVSSLSIFHPIRLRGA